MLVVWFKYWFVVNNAHDFLSFFLEQLSTRGLPTSSSHAPKGIDSFLNNFIWRTFKYFDLKMCLLFINDALYDTHYHVNIHYAKLQEYKFFLLPFIVSIYQVFLYMLPYLYCLWNICHSCNICNTQVL